MTEAPRFLNGWDTSSEILRSCGFRGESHLFCHCPIGTTLALQTYTHRAVWSYRNDGDGFYNRVESVAKGDHPQGPNRRLNAGGFFITGLAGVPRERLGHGGAGRVHVAPRSVFKIYRFRLAHTRTALRTLEERSSMPRDYSTGKNMVENARSYLSFGGSMREYRTRTVSEVVASTCDRCQRRLTADHPGEWEERLSFDHSCGFDSVFGDGNTISLDLCQQCVQEVLGQWLQITKSADISGPDL